MGLEIGSPCLVFCGLSALKLYLDIEVYAHQRFKFLISKFLLNFFVFSQFYFLI